MTEGEGSTELRPLARLARLALAWTLVTVAGPGVLARDGTWWIAAIGVALWIATVARPGRRAWLVEWLAAGAAVAFQVWWIAYVVAFVVPAQLVVSGFWASLGGPLARRLLARRALPFTLLAPLAWLFAEGLQHGLQIPFSWGWMRLGHVAAGDLWLASSARVAGAVGLSAVIAGVGGALADLAARRAETEARSASWPGRSARSSSARSPRCRTRRTDPSSCSSSPRSPWRARWRATRTPCSTRRSR
ncbi:MAG: hypothetical protein R3F34_08160 [Planctomycetota bacterium]